MSINHLYFQLAEFHSKTGFNFIAFAPVGTNSSEVAKSKKSQIFVYTLTSTLLLTKTVTVTKMMSTTMSNDNDHDNFNDIMIIQNT